MGGDAGDRLAGSRPLGLYTERNLCFPYARLVAELRRRRPQLPAAVGDQCYEHRPTTKERAPEPTLDVLYRWYLWLWASRDLTRSVPTVVLVDDDDVYHPNLWGNAGAPAPGGDHRQGRSSHSDADAAVAGRRAALEPVKRAGALLCRATSTWPAWSATAWTASTTARCSSSPRPPAAPGSAGSSPPAGCPTRGRPRTPATSPTPTATACGSWPWPTPSSPRPPSGPPAAAATPSWATATANARATAWSGWTSGGAGS